jgi:hypothetical protein
MLREELTCLRNIIVFLLFVCLIFFLFCSWFLNRLLCCREDAKDPKLWSRICVHNMAKFAREATTFRRILESVFRCFGSSSSWSPDNGLALCVLLDMQLLVEHSGTSFAFYESIEVCRIKATQFLILFK